MYWYCKAEWACQNKQYDKWATNSYETGITKKLIHEESHIGLYNFTFDHQK